MVLFVLTAMTAAALAASRNVTRELSMAGDGLQGARAGCAADAGVAWVLAWAVSGDGNQVLVQENAFRLPASGGVQALPAEPGAGAQAFTLTGACLGFGPTLGEAAPDRLWRVEVQGWAWPPGAAPQGPGCRARRELILQLRPPGGAGPQLRVGAWRTLW